MYDNHRVNKGLSLLSQGYIKEADEIFCDLLKQYPDFAEALYGRACVARTTGNQALAIGFAGQAIQIKSISYYHIPLGLALYEQGHVVEAEAALKSAILLNPYDSRAYHGLAIIQERNGDKAQAELSFRKAIELEPTSLIYWKELIRFYWQGKAFQQALNIAKDAVKYNVGKVEFLHELAVILYQLGEFGDAERVFRKIIRLNPETISAYANLGAILFQCHQLKEAQKYLTYAFKKEPENIETQVNLGLLQMGLGLLLEAKTLLKNAYQHKKNDSRIALNLGTIFYELRELDAAEKLYRVLLAPSYSFPIIENDCYKIKYNLSTVLLAKGRLVEGWDQMESRHSLLNHFKESSKIPLWNGKDKVGKLLVRVEQGLGDALQFSRYLPLLLQKCSIVVEVPKLLMRLFQQIMCNHHQEYSWEIIEKEHQFPSDITHQIMLMSIPHVLQIDHIKEYQLSLNVNQEEMLPKTLNKFKVGICWSGNKEYRFDLLRSIPISKFTSILQVSDIDFYALQTDLKKTDLPKYFLGALPNGDLLKTANIIQQLDLVITVDTMIAHLAGMLGKPVWLLNRFGGDWRWYSPYRHHRKSLWYPNFKIFQQQQIFPPDQAWNAIIEEVKAELVLFTS